MMPVFLALTLLLSGCASLLVHEHDSAPVVASKVMWRAILGVSTLGLSEVHLAHYRQEEQVDERLTSYEEHLTYLVNNDLLTQQEAERLYQEYASLLLQEITDPYEQRMAWMTAATSTFGYGLGAASRLSSFSPSRSSSWRSHRAFGERPSQWRQSRLSGRGYGWRPSGMFRSYGMGGAGKSGGGKGGGGRAGGRGGGKGR